MAQGCGAETTWYQVVQQPLLGYDGFVNGYRDVEVPMEAHCGDSQTDIHGHTEYRYCEYCYAKYLKEYPKGWETYPGDVCPHGVYVGGVGIDRLCHICEGGGR